MKHYECKIERMQIYAWLGWVFKGRDLVITERNLPGIGTKLVGGTNGGFVEKLN